MCGGGVKLPSDFLSRQFSLYGREIAGEIMLASRLFYALSTFTASCGAHSVRSEVCPAFSGKKSNQSATFKQENWRQEMRSEAFPAFCGKEYERSAASKQKFDGKKKRSEVYSALFGKEFERSDSYTNFLTEKKMNQIQTISLPSMNNAAHFLFVSNVADKAEKDVSVAEKCAAQVKALRAAVSAEDESLQLSAKSLATDKIAAADRLRDQLYAGYKKAVAGYVNFPVADIAEAAAALSQHIKDYKINPQAQLDAETGLLVNFIQDLEGKYKAQVEKLSLAAFVQQLKAANESVRELTAQRTDERAAKTTGALKNARCASDEAYRELVNHVNAHALLEGEAEYNAFIGYANTEIEHFKQEVLGGKKGKGKTSASEEEVIGNSAE